MGALALRREGRVLEVGYAFAEPAYLGGLLRTGSTSSASISHARRRRDGGRRRGRPRASVPGRSFDSVLLVSTLEHVGADNTVYGLEAESDAAVEARGASRAGARAPATTAASLVTVPLGEPGDHGWFRQEDEAGWTALFAGAGFFVEEVEASTSSRRRLACRAAFVAERRRYGERGPGASAVLCADLAPGRLRRLLTPSGLATTAKRRLRPLRHRTRENG